MATHSSDCFSMSSNVTPFSSQLHPPSTPQDHLQSIDSALLANSSSSISSPKSSFSTTSTSSTINTTDSSTSSGSSGLTLTSSGSPSIYPSPANTIESPEQIIGLVMSQLEDQRPNRLSSTSTITITGIPGSPDPSTTPLSAFEADSDAAAATTTPINGANSNNSSTPSLSDLSSSSISYHNLAPQDRAVYKHPSTPPHPPSGSLPPHAPKDKLRSQHVLTLPTSLPASSSAPDSSISLPQRSFSSSSPAPTLSSRPLSDDTATSLVHTAAQMASSPTPTNAAAAVAAAVATDPDMPPLNDGAAVQLNNKGLTMLPPELFETMRSSVSKLSLQANQLSYLPPEIQSMKFMTYLDISYNRFTEFPSVLTKCPSLIILDISHNEIQRLPKDIGHLDGLRILSLSHNKFRYMPPAILDMVDLMVIQVDENPWVYPPKEIIQHPDAQAADQTEWLDLLRTYMENNMGKIQKELDQDLELQQKKQQKSQHPASSEPPTNVAATAPAQSQKIISPTNTTAPSTPITAIQPIESHTTISDIETLSAWFKNNESFDDHQRKEGIGPLLEKVDRKMSIAEQQQQAISTPSIAASSSSIPSTSSSIPAGPSSSSGTSTQSSRALKRMGFVVKKPTRGNSLDSESSRTGMTLPAQGFATTTTGGSTPSVPSSSTSTVAATQPMPASVPAPATPSSASTSASVTAPVTAPGQPPLSSSSSSSLTDSLNESNSSSLAISDLNKPGYPGVPMSPEDRHLPTLAASAVLRSPSRRTSQSIHSINSHSHDFDTIPESGHSSIGSSASSSGFAIDRLPSFDETPYYPAATTASTSSSAAALLNVTMGSTPVILPSSSNSSFPSLHNLHTPTHSISSTGNGGGGGGGASGAGIQSLASRLRTNSHSSRERSHSLSVTSSPEKESASGAYFRRLSTLTEEIKPTSSTSTLSASSPRAFASVASKSPEYTECLEVERRIVFTARTILFSLVEFQSILRRCARLCNDKSISVKLSELLYTGQSYNDSLVRALEQEETRSRTSEEVSIEELQSITRKIALTSVTSMKHFRHMAQFCSDHLFGFTSHIDIKFIRCLILTTFGSFNELFNSWNTLNEIESPPKYPPLLDSTQSSTPVSLSRSDTVMANMSKSHQSPLAMPSSSVFISSHLSSPTTPSGPAPPGGFGMLHSVSGSLPSPQLSSTFAEADDALYHGLEAAAAAAKTLLRQLTETLSKESSGSKTPNASVTSHVKNLSHRCVVGVEVTQRLKEQLDNLGKTRTAATAGTASTNPNGGASTNGTSTPAGLFSSQSMLDLADRRRFWDDMNAFVKGMIGLLASTKSAITDLPYLKNTQNLATLSKLTKDIPPLMDASSYKLLMVSTAVTAAGVAATSIPSVSALADGKEHAASISGPVMSSASAAATPSVEALSLSGHPSFISIPASINANFQQQQLSTSAATGAPNPSTSGLPPLTLPRIHSPGPMTAPAAPGLHELTSPTAAGGQFFPPPTTPLSAVLGPAAAAVAMPSPPINKTFTNSPFFPPHGADLSLATSNSASGPQLTTTSSSSSFPSTAGTNGAATGGSVGGASSGQPMASSTSASAISSPLMMPTLLSGISGYNASPLAQAAAAVVAAQAAQAAAAAAAGLSSSSSSSSTSSAVPNMTTIDGNMSSFSLAELNSTLVSPIMSKASLATAGGPATVPALPVSQQMATYFPVIADHLPVSAGGVPPVVSPSSLYLHQNMNNALNHHQQQQSSLGGAGSAPPPFDTLSQQLQQQLQQQSSRTPSRVPSRAQNRAPSQGAAAVSNQGLASSVGGYNHGHTLSEESVDSISSNMTISSSDGIAGGSQPVKSAVSEAAGGNSISSSTGSGNNGRSTTHSRNQSGCSMDGTTRWYGRPPSAAENETGAGGGSSVGYGGSTSAAAPTSASVVSNNVSSTGVRSASSSVSSGSETVYSSHGGGHLPQ